MLTVNKFVSALPEPDPLGLKPLSIQLKSYPGVWAEIELSGISAWIIRNSIIRNQLEHLPSELFDAEIVEGKLYIRYTPA